MSIPADLDANATAYEEILRNYTPERFDELAAAYDTMVEAVEEAEHDIDTCSCRSCVFYRTATLDPQEN